MTHDLRMSGDYEYQSLYHGFVTQRQWNKNKLNLIKNLQFLNKNDILLDAGCGSGNAVVKYARFVKRVEGWDINPNSVAFLKKQIKAKGIKNAVAYCRDLTNLKGKQKFTKIILSEVIEHFSEKDYLKMLHNMHNSLVMRGKIFITTPNDHSHWPILEFLLNKLQKLKGIPTLEDRHIAHFTNKKLQKIIEKAGFTVELSATLNHISPFLFFLPEKFRDKIGEWESKQKKFGGLLYIVARKI